MSIRKSYQHRLCAFFLALSIIGGASVTAQVAPAPPDPLALSNEDVMKRFTDIKIEQKLNNQIPGDLLFTNEEGQPVTLGQFFGEKPIILSLVYYECPAICNAVLNGMVAVFDGMTLKLGEDYEVVTVSIDPTETPELAAEKKASYLRTLNQPGAQEGWHFLTGTEESIETLANLVGFRYFYDKEADLYVHAGGIMVLTPDGRVSRYYFDTEFLPRDIRLGLVEASEGKIGNLIDSIVLLCYAYDPQSGTYSFYVIRAMRVMAIMVMAGLLGFWGISALKKKKTKAPRTAEGDGIHEHNHT